MKVLHIDAGVTFGSLTRQLSAAVVEQIAKTGYHLEIVRRDLDAQPVPDLDGRGPGTLADNPLLQEFLGADVIVIGAPMYNFGIPSQLKAWFDHVMVVDKTFRFTSAGAEGLASGKMVLIASARGGVHAPGMLPAVIDFQEPYIRSLFHFIGIEDVTFIRAEGLAMGPEHRDAAREEAIASAPAVAREASPAVRRTASRGAHG